MKILGIAKEDNCELITIFDGYLSKNIFRDNYAEIIMLLFQFSIDYSQKYFFLYKNTGHSEKVIHGLKVRGA